MASVKKYQEIVRNLIQEYASHKPSHGEIDVRAIIDEERGQYQIVHVGWQGKIRVHGSPIHIELIDDKVWIQYDGTSPGVAVELVESGIPKEDIVLGFRPPHIRPHTGFGVG
jgi:hypothetical protein